MRAKQSNCSTTSVLFFDLRRELCLDSPFPLQAQMLHSMMSTNIVILSSSIRRSLCSTPLSVRLSSFRTAWSSPPSLCLQSPLVNDSPVRRAAARGKRRKRRVDEGKYRRRTNSRNRLVFHSRHWLVTNVNYHNFRPPDEADVSCSGERNRRNEHMERVKHRECGKIHPNQVIESE